MNNFNYLPSTNVDELKKHISDYVNENYNGDYIRFMKEQNVSFSKIDGISLVDPKCKMNDVHAFACDLVLMYLLIENGFEFNKSDKFDLIKDGIALISFRALVTLVESYSRDSDMEPFGDESGFTRLKESFNEMKGVYFTEKDIQNVLDSLLACYKYETEHRA